MKARFLLLLLTHMSFIGLYSQTQISQTTTHAQTPSGVKATTGAQNTQTPNAQHPKVQTAVPLQASSHSGFSIDYFEVYTKLAHNKPSTGFTFHRDSILSRINSIPDTAATIATFVVSLSDPTSADTLFYSLKDSKGNVVYTTASKVSSLKNNPQFKLSGKTLYLSVGPYPYLKHFTATASIKATNGHITQTKSFTKK